MWLASFAGESEQTPALPYRVAHIWTHLLEVGPVANGAMGPVPLSFLEIEAWMRTTSMHLSAWEVVLLRKCSQEWVSATYNAKDPYAVPPWAGAEERADRRTRVGKNLMAALAPKKAKK